VRQDLADADDTRVLATVGERTVALAPEAPGSRVVAGAVPAAGDGGGAGADLVHVTIAIEGLEPATWQGRAAPMRAWLPWARR